MVVFDKGVRWLLQLENNAGRKDHFGGFVDGCYTHGNSTTLSASSFPHLSSNSRFQVLHAIAIVSVSSRPEQSLFIDSRQICHRRGGNAGIKSPAVLKPDSSLWLLHPDVAYWC